MSGLIPSDGYWLFVACIGLLAIAGAWFNAPLMTLLQKGIPEDKLGRVMGLFTAMNGLAIPIGTALGGAVAEITGTPMFFTIDGVLILAMAPVLPCRKTSGNWIKGTALVSAFATDRNYRDVSPPPPATLIATMLRFGIQPTDCHLVKVPNLAIASSMVIAPVPTP